MNKTRDENRISVLFIQNEKKDKVSLPRKRRKPLLRFPLSAQNEDNGLIFEIE